MSKSLNKILLIGNVGGDPDIKYTPSGTAVAKFSLATNESYKDKSGEWQERVEWHNIVAWQRLAEIAGEYVHKGKKLFIEGRLQTSSWQDKQNGDKKYRTEIVARNILLLGDGGGNGNGNGNGQAGAQQGHSPRHPAPPREHEVNAYEGGISDEEIPF